MYRLIKVIILIGLFTGILLVNSSNGFGAIDEDAISSVINVPNPFNAGTDTTMIRYLLSSGSYEISITIYNLIGDIVKIFDNTGECPNVSDSINQLEWDGRNGLDMEVANGCYICEIVAVSNEVIVDRDLLKIAVLK